MKNISGFYKINSDKNILYASLLVMNKEYTLKKELKDTYSYPIDGWYWFNSEDEAYTFFGIEKPTVENVNKRRKER